MARAPSPSALSASPAGGMPSGGTMGADPSDDGDPGDDTDSGGDVVCTITKNGDGSYMVYAGDEPSSGDDSDMSDDDADAMAPPGGAAGGGGGAGGGMSASQGIPADSVGAALKAALDILNADKSSEGAPGNADDQLAAGFSADKSPRPASGPKQKY